MDETLKDVLNSMFIKKYIGGKHIPEKLFIKSFIKFADNNTRNKFYEEYSLIIKKEYIMRLKKRTGRGFDWHISLNPHTLENLYEEMK